MKTEYEKMRSAELANTSDAEIQKSIINGKIKVHAFNNTYYDSETYRDLLDELIPNVPVTTSVIPPFYCDHGNGIQLGNHVFINSNCTFLDGAMITIGDYTLIGPHVQMYTPQHPMDSRERRQPIEYAYPIHIGKDCWIGGGAIICPGVKIGDKCIIGAGSVVTKDIPDNSLAVGNPARVIKKVE